METDGRSRGQIDAILEAQRREMSRQQEDVHACRRLWKMVIERTVDDIRFLHRTAKRSKLKKHEGQRLRCIRGNPPEEFLCSAWFDQICDYLQVDPQRIRSAIRQIETEAESA